MLPINYRYFFSISTLKRCYLLLSEANKELDEVQLILPYQPNNILDVLDRIPNQDFDKEPTDVSIIVIGIILRILVILAFVAIVGIGMLGRLLGHLIGAVAILQP